jgi:hypothetical protein
MTTENSYNPNVRPSDQIAGITSAQVQAIYGIPQGGTIKIYPTVAGSATLYTSCSPLATIAADVAGSDLTTPGASALRWDASISGVVTTTDIVIAAGALKAAALKVSSGTWTMEVVR